MKRILLSVPRSSFLFSVCLAVTSTMVSFGQGSSPAPADTVIRAMSDELARSIVELKLNNLDAPYFIQYTILESDEYAARATFGALTQATPSQQRLIHANVRVGNYDFDNSEFAGGAQTGGQLYQATIDDDYDSLRHTLWLATDASYKSAVETIAQKRSAIQNKTQQEDPVPDFSKEPATVAYTTKKKLEFDRAKVEAQLRQWSQIFREFPDVQSSSVTFRARQSYRYIVNSEGTRTIQPQMLLILQASASTQAADGMQLSYSIPVYTRTFENLPSTDAFAATVRQLGKDLTALRAAPALSSDYSGPALLVGQASTEMFARVLAPALAGQRGPLSRTGQSSSPALEDRMNRPILPANISVLDDPTKLTLGDKKLIGYYDIDDQGVAVKPLSLVDGGLLTNLLMSRRPGKGRLQSNGHGRNGYPGRETPQVGNLLVTATGGKSYDELKAELIQTAKDERLDYGIAIKALNQGGNGPIGTPVLTYKVYVADGREELVRVGGASGLSVQSLRHILAVGTDTYVANRVVGTAGAETPTSVVAPSVIVEEISLDKPSGTQQKPSLMTHPFFGN